MRQEHKQAERELVVVPVPPSSRPAGIISPWGAVRENAISTSVLILFPVSARRNGFAELV